MNHQRNMADDAQALVIEASAMIAARSRLTTEAAFEKYVQPVIADAGASGHALLQRIARDDGQTLLHMLQAVCAFTAQAVHADIEGRPDDVCPHLCDAHRWMGTARAMAVALKHRPELKSAAARTRKRHEWGEQIKAWAAGKLDDYPSASTLAEDAIKAGAVTGIKKKTIENAIGKLFPGWKPKA